MSPKILNSKQWHQRGRQFHSTHDDRFDLFSDGQHNWVCLDADLGRVRTAQ